MQSFKLAAGLVLLEHTQRYAMHWSLHNIYPGITLDICAKQIVIKHLTVPLKEAAVSDGSSTMQKAASNVESPSLACMVQVNSFL